MFTIFWLLCVTAEASSILFEGGFSKPFELNFGNVAKCVTEICKSTTSYRSTVILRNTDYVAAEKQLFLQNFINSLTTNNIQVVIFDDLDKLHDITIAEEADWIAVVYFKSCQEVFEFNFAIIHNEIKYIIIVSDSLNKDCETKFLEIGKYIANYDVTFLFENEEMKDVKALFLITFIPEINGETCKQVVRGYNKINTCRNGILETRIFFPDKNPTNLKKCAINVGIGPLYPFAIIKNMTRFKTFDILDETDIRGSDPELVKIVAKQYNATLKYYFVQKKEENPFGQNDFVPFIINGSLDVCAGGFYRIYGDVVSYSGIYARQAVLWMYTADRNNKSWHDVVQKVNGLYIFMIYYISYCFLWYLMRKFDNEAVSLISTLTYAWGALVGTASLHDARSLKQKIVNLMYLVMCIHLSAYIGVQFYAFFTISEPPEILETNNDIMNSGRRPYLIPSSKYFVLDQKYITFANESEECCTFLDCSEKSLMNKGTTVLLKGFFINFQAQTAVNNEAKVLGTTENILTVYYEMLIRRNSPYVTKFQDTMKRLFEAGIPEKLFMDAIGLTVIGKAKSASDNIISNSYSCQAGCKISLEHLDGAFYVWLLGCCISGCVFLVELIGKREKVASVP